MQAVQLVQVVQLVLSAALVALLTPQVSSKADVKLQLKQYFFNPSVSLQSLEKESVNTFATVQSACS